MAFGELYSTLGSYRALDNWSQAMGASVAGAGKIGFKANRSSFLGGTISQTVQPGRSNAITRTGEQTLYSETAVDWSQGDLVDTDTPNNFGIRGEGFFLVMDDDRKFYYTRGGDFTFKDGKLKTPQGLTVIDKTILETLTRQAGMGANALPTNISAALGVATSVAPNYVETTAPGVVDLHTATSPWYKPTGAGGSMWFPYISDPTSQYLENPDGVFGNADDSYRAMGISLKTSVFVDKSQGINAANAASTLVMNGDNVGYAWVNGHQLSKLDLAAPVATVDNPWGGYPVAGGYAAGNVSTFNIGQYLTTGVNTIQLYAAEWEAQPGNAKEFMNASATIGLASGGPITIASTTGNNSQWTSKLIGPDLDKDYYLPGAPYLGRTPSPVSQTYEDRMFHAEARDFVLAKVDYKDGMRFSKYGNTVFETTPAAGNVSLWEQGQAGVGRVELNKLEASNVDFDNISSEMKMAEHMYDNLANILQTRYSMIDTMFQYLIP